LDNRKIVKTLLFVFVAMSIAVLIYKEISPRGERNATEVAVAKADTTSISGKSVPVTENQTAKETSTTKQKAEPPSQKAAVKSHSAKVVVYYFHGTFRCTTCRTIEKYSHDAVQQYFPKELGNGKLEFRPVNVEEPENRHFIQDYQLFSKSLVLSLVRDDKETKSKNLTDIWTLVKDKDKFFQYVKNEVEGFLKETQ
jgi:hypothetical protein